MNMDISEPGPLVRQVSGMDADRNWLLAVLVKRTYLLEDTGRCVPHPEQIPLMDDAEESDDGTLVADTDLIPFKPLTDVVIRGTARSVSSAGPFHAEVHVEQWQKSVLVIGDRQCSVSSGGTLSFSPPQPVTEVPLRYEFAYGGGDPVAERDIEHPLANDPALLPEGLTLEDLNVCVYPRNPVGVGYLVKPIPEAVDGLRLPNLEDPYDRLTPERLALGSHENWLAYPMSQAMDWMHYGWFPRCAYLGVLPPFDPEGGTAPEVARGLAPDDLAETRSPWEKFSLRSANGASTGLQFPHLRGDEEVRLVNIHPTRSHFSFRLPGERPEIWTDGRDGTYNATHPVLQTVLLEPDEHRVSVVWRGAAPARRPYRPEELSEMPLHVRWP